MICAITFPAIQLQKQYLRRLDDSMTDKNTINLCYLKVLLVGPPGVGKTTTLNRLLKAYENICTAGDKAMRRSTLLANCTQVLAFVGCLPSVDTMMRKPFFSFDICVGTSWMNQLRLQIKRSLCECRECPQSKRHSTSESISESPLIQFRAAEFSVSEVPVSTKKLEHLQMVKEQLRKLVRGEDYILKSSATWETLC